MRAFWSAAVVLLALTACGINQQPTPSLVTLCEIPRPQVCTMEYAPVCGSLIADGKKEFSSGCNACANDAVASYISGPCASDER
jgi:hypothetical protein